jgi:hypothetical protein
MVCMFLDGKLSLGGPPDGSLEIEERISSALPRRSAKPPGLKETRTDRGAVGASGATRRSAPGQLQAEEREGSHAAARTHGSFSLIASVNTRASGLAQAKRASGRCRPAVDA